MNRPEVYCIRPSYETFHRQIAKALLVGTGQNTEYKNGKFSGFQKELDDVIKEFGETNIFMSVGISMLVTSFEVYLKSTFLCLLESNPDCRKDIISIHCKEVADDSSTKDIVLSNRQKFNFQNLKYTNKNFKKVFDVDLKEVLDNEKRTRGFKHPVDEIEELIAKQGLYSYLVNKEHGGLILRHKIIHQSYTSKDAKAIFLMMYEVFKYFSTSLVENMYQVNFDEIPR